MDTILLYLARGDFRNEHVAEIRQQVPVEDFPNVRDPSRATLAIGKNLILSQELFGDDFEGFALLENTGARLAAQVEIPVLGKLSRQGGGLLLGRLPPVP